MATATRETTVTLVLTGDEADMLREVLADFDDPPLLAIFASLRRLDEPF